MQIQRTVVDVSKIKDIALSEAKKGSPPDLLAIDNPMVSTLAQKEVLAPLKEVGLDTRMMLNNLIEPGIYEANSYGIPLGANTVGLYYNAKILRDAGVDPATVRDWASLTAALAKVKASGKKGITFAAPSNEEASFQFLPWLWGAGGDLLNLDTPEVAAALSLWKDWHSQGYTDESVTTNSQNDSWNAFTKGEYAFSENGSWQLQNAKELRFDHGVISIPAMNGGAAEAPLGGEMLIFPDQKDDSRYKTTKRIAECLTNRENILKTDSALHYLAPTLRLQNVQKESDKAIEPWAEAVSLARGRTAGDIGTDYVIISRHLQTALQAVLSGSQEPEDALKSAARGVARDTY